MCIRDRIYITTKKTKAVEKTIAKGNMKVECKVVDEQGEPVIGAAVLIEGTTTGSVTDVNGNFVLSVPSKDAVLVVCPLTLPIVVLGHPESYRY